MAKDQNKRLTPKELGNNVTSFDALKNVTGYTPANVAYTVANIKTIYDAMIASQTAETQAEAAYRTARDKAVTAEWNFHNAVLGGKAQVKAQFGADSNELQALGLKKASEYKRPAARKAKAEKASA